MRSLLVAGVVLFSLTAGPAYSAEITDQNKCRSEVDIVKKMDDDNDVGPKFEPIVKNLIDVLEHLCETKAFDKAEEVASSIRGMLASE